MSENNLEMPKFPEPYWRDSVTLPSFQSLKEDLTTDVAIVGGGITGITSAYLLAKEGIKVALIDAGNILNGTTGHTTAKVTAQHGVIYDELIQHFGTEKAKHYYEAANEAVEFVRSLVKELDIHCDFSDEDAYIYTNDTKYIRQLQTEMKAYETLGIESEYVTELPFDLPIKAAICMKNQAQFHPLKYLHKLVSELIKLGGEIYEQTTAVDVDQDGDHLKVVTLEGPAIHCKQVLACSHYPFYDGQGLYFTRMYAERSYIIAVKAEKEFPGGMYISAEQPTRSLRYTMMDGEKLLLIGGENHKTGQGIPTILHYEALEAYAREQFGIKEYLYRWSAQDLTTLDKVPYIGRITNHHPNVFVATGFRKWGMTNGTTAALLLRDLLLGKENPYEELYTPTRFKADPSIKNLIQTNVDVAKHLVEGKLEYPLRQVEDLAHDEGAVVQFHGKRAGAYKDDQGVVHIVDTTCSHLGCEVEWNSGDRSWDCPCHGSRFSITGEVIEGPAETPLEKLE
ncbi:glycine/D-amino acid oxidase-like deaminating enzyme/nitrite reductase/ring-hydroxylating ferredoxin subunit [Oikeobacillus pervagus]|uniref:Glycine/D-amino acid oxidase-like deaminating enzyme/nitrite reductase/ring-hydroxylating ferredoxin subunit n=1 Tax=Oikeobacillus pervagus TaxID=1325931 RepID=A0AAJ1T120_9BACI|nr:FAD-dependent oxidoreductase [Oikeobacillus pervagus]MDQ0216344.1 glycine/D-amino acid oxidase-like deaminating enzyme/nitrite reductase/ring-hydroxylating ferredoxin subunit [Oikeobacillus pervagus]